MGLLVLLGGFAVVLNRGGSETASVDPSSVADELRVIHEAAWTYAQANSPGKYTWEAFAYGPGLHTEPAAVSQGVYAHAVVLEGLLPAGVSAKDAQYSVAISKDQSRAAIASGAGSRCVLLVAEQGEVVSLGEDSKECVGSREEGLLDVGNGFPLLSEAVADGSVTLSWNALKGATEYSGRCWRGGSEVRFESRTSLSTTVEGLLPYQLYFCALEAIHPLGPLLSAEIQVTPTVATFVPPPQWGSLAPERLPSSLNASLRSVLPRTAEPSSPARVLAAAPLPSSGESTYVLADSEGALHVLSGGVTTLLAEAGSVPEAVSLVPGFVPGQATQSAANVPVVSVVYGVSRTGKVSTVDLTTGIVLPLADAMVPLNSAAGFSCSALPQNACLTLGSSAGVFEVALPSGTITSVGGRVDALAPQGPALLSVFEGSLALGESVPGATALAATSTGVFALTPGGVVNVADPALALFQASYLLTDQGGQDLVYLSVDGRSLRTLASSGEKVLWSSTSE